MRILAALCVLGGAITSRADVTYNFEDLPGTIGNFVDIGNHYANVSFGAGVQGYDSISGFPTHSGVTGIGDENTPIPGTINFSVVGLNVTGVSFWYTTVAQFTATAYAANNTVLGTFVSNTGNTDGLTGSDAFASILASGGFVDHVSIVSSFNLFNGYLTLDDLTLSTPDAASTLGLLGLAVVGMLGYRRFQVA